MWFHLLRGLWVFSVLKLFFVTIAENLCHLLYDWKLQNVLVVWRVYDSHLSTVSPISQCFVPSY